MKKKVLVLTLIVALAVGVVSPFAFAAEELTVWVSNGDETNWMIKAAELYQDKTGVKVKVESVPEIDQAQRLALDGPSGKGADVVGWFHDKLGRTVVQGLVEPIGKYLPEGYAEENYLENSVEALTYNGKLYGLPYAFQSIAMIYNKDFYPEPPKTFDELITKAKKLTNARQDKYGFLFEANNFYYSGAIFNAYGAYPFGKNADGSYNFTDMTLANAGGIKAAKLIKSFRDEGLIPKGTTGDTINGLFGEGKVGAMFNGDWRIKDIKESGVNYAVAPMPKLPNGKYPETFLTVKGYYVSKFSKNKQAAADFIKFVTNAKMSMDHYETNGILVPHKEVVNSDKLMNNPDIRGFIIQARRGIPMPNAPEFMQVWSPANNAMTFILNGQMPAETILPMTVDMIQEGIMQMR